MIEHWDPDTDGNLNEENMRTKLGARGYTINKYIYPPGTYFPDHSHEVDKIDGVLSGQFRMNHTWPVLNTHSGRLYCSATLCCS